MSGEEDQRALREAARWYAELQDETAGLEIWRKFSAWERLPGNAAAFRKVEAALSTLDRARAGAGNRRAQRRQVWPLVAGLAAAILVSALAGHQFFGRQAAPDPDVRTYVTLVGEQETALLADGSRIVLNTESELDVRYSESERRIVLVEGQALFDVRGEARPFVVVAGGAETRALGTRFDVYLTADQGLQVTLLEGLVSISAGGAGGEVSLSPGEQMVFRDGARTISRVDVTRAGAWTSGMVPFTDATLEDAAAELNRYSAVKLRVDEAVAGERISGSFRAGDQEAFTAALEVFLPVVAERRGEEIFILPAD